MNQVPEDVRRRLATAIAALHRDTERRAAANPKAYRDSRSFRQLRYRYVQTANRGRAVRYCWTTTRNIAGYYLRWRESETKDGFTRDLFASFEKRKDAKASALNLSRRAS